GNDPVSSENHRQYSMVAAERPLALNAGDVRVVTPLSTSQASVPLPAGQLPVTKQVTPGGGVWSSSGWTRVQPELVPFTFTRTHRLFVELVSPVVKKVQPLSVSASSEKAAGFRRMSRVAVPPAGTVSRDRAAEKPNFVASSCCVPSETPDREYDPSAAVVVE